MNSNDNLTRIDFVVYAVLLVFSFWLMFQTFSYEYNENLILIEIKIWSDFGGNLPLIRSFSLGDNWPPEYPIYPGLPIQYHFLFFLMVGLLEKAGVPIHWALNIPSAVGFFLLLSMLYAIGKRLFKDTRVALLGVVFLVFNGSMSFLQFFEKYPLSASTLTDILNLLDYPAMGPWDGGKVLGFWHLNIYINQRHFCLALGILMLFKYLIMVVEDRSQVTQITVASLFGVIVGLFPLFHKPAMLLFALVMIVFFIFLSRLRFALFLMGLVCVLIVGALWLFSFSITGPAQTNIAWHPGFTIHGTTDIWAIVSFLWYQFGLHLILIPIGFYLAPARARIFILPAILALAIAFMFRFSSDVMANHKFINYFLIMGQLFSAYAIIRLFDIWIERLEYVPEFREYLGKAAAAAAFAIVILFSTLSGIIEFFPIYNNRFIPIRDLEASPEAKWFNEHTPKNAVVLTNTLLYHPASVAGRKIFLGWAYFTSTAGYDHNGRMEVVKSIFASEDTHSMCEKLRKNNISYIAIEDVRPDPNLPPVNKEFFRVNFQPEFRSMNGSFEVYSTSKICKPASG